MFAARADVERAGTDFAYAPRRPASTASER
jgi:hypothetical protein